MLSKSNELQGTNLEHSGHVEQMIKDGSQSKHRHLKGPFKWPNRVPICFLIRSICLGVAGDETGEKFT